ncbi:MAG: hypothetical protein KA807_07225 [Prolixibacteraceae bacterium]|nr:hypothetical protein [Prolixibacteraceae bacterium]
MKKLFLIILLSITLTGGSEGNEMNKMYLKQGELDLSRLVGSKIFFAHQSVGYNIVSGIENILKESGVADIKVIEITDPNQFSEAVFGHMKIGQNKDPFSKLADFRLKMESGIGERTTIACFKFCYVDVTRDTNLESVMRFYSKTFDYLEKKFPKTVFIHFTVPLLVQPRGFLITLKRKLGISVNDDLDNVARNNFNDLLRAKYRERVFDMARFESEYDKQNETFIYKNQKYTSLLPIFTDDGGHLNGLGARVIAYELLSYLNSKAQ